MDADTPAPADAGFIAGFIPVPPDGRCLCHVARAARNVEQWMEHRDDHGWRHHRDMEREDLGAAKALLGKVIAHMQSLGMADEAERLTLAGPRGYPGMDELKYFAAVLEGRIELSDVDEPNMPIVYYGDVGPLLFRVGHQWLGTEDGCPGS